MTILRLLALLLPLLTAFVAPAAADEAELREIIAKFATAKGFAATKSIVEELAAVGDHTHIE